MPSRRWAGETKLLAIAVGAEAHRRIARGADDGRGRSSWLGLQFLGGHGSAANTPRNIVNRLHQETAKALNGKAVQGSMAKLGAESMLMRPDEFDAYIRNEIKTNAELVRAAGIATGAR